MTDLENALQNLGFAICEAHENCPPDVWTRINDADQALRLALEVPAPALHDDERDLTDEDRIAYWKGAYDRMAARNGDLSRQIASLGDPSDPLLAQVLEAFNGAQEDVKNHLFHNSINLFDALTRAKYAMTPTGEGETDLLVDRFADALKTKLRAAEAKYGWQNGWMKPDWSEDCQRDLARHVTKGDPLDVAAYAAFCWHHGWSTALAHPQQGGKRDGEQPEIEKIDRADGTPKHAQYVADEHGTPITGLSWCAAQPHEKKTSHCPTCGVGPLEACRGRVPQDDEVKS